MNERMEENFALIIGINDYTPLNKNGLRTLHGAVNDADDFEEWVRNPDGGNVTEKNCKKIVSKPNPLKPLQDEVDDAFLVMEQRIQENGGKAKRLYFYFAGHGLGTLHNTNDTALCLANWSENRRKSALSSESYKDVIKQYGYFEEIIFLADCCRNSKINVNGKEPTFAPFMPHENSGNTKLFVGYATTYQDQSYEVEVENSEMRGVFTKVLIDGLNGDAAKDGVINADKLRDYLLKRTPIEAQKHGFKQVPDINHSFSSETPIVTLTNALEQSIVCNIKFITTRNALVELIDGSSEVITSFDPTEDNEVQVSLEKGLYLLRDTSTDEIYPIRVSHSNQEIYVEF